MVHIGMQHQPSPLVAIATAIRILSHVNSSRLSALAFRFWMRKRPAVDSPWVLGGCFGNACAARASCAALVYWHQSRIGLRGRCMPVGMPAVASAVGAIRRGACTCALSFIPVARRGLYFKSAPAPALPGAFADATPTRMGPPPEATCSPLAMGAWYEGRWRLLQCPSWRLPPLGRWQRQQNRHTTPIRRINLNKTKLGCHKFDAIATMCPL